MMIINVNHCVCRYRDEDEEPLMDYDDIRSDPEQSPEHQQHQNDNVLDDFDDDDVGDGGVSPARERSQTPVYNNNEKSSKPRKRLVKKGAKESGSTPSLIDEREDEYDDEGEDNIIGDDFEREIEERKRKKWGKEGGKDHNTKKRLKSGGDKKFSSSGGKSSGFKSSRAGSIRDNDKMLNEMWNAVAPTGDSEVGFFVSEYWFLFVHWFSFVYMCCLLDLNSHLNRMIKRALGLWMMITL